MDYKVDLADVIESNFQMSSSIAVVSRVPDLELHLGDDRLNIWQKLRVIQKQVDIVAVAMIELQHQRRSAAEGPVPKDVAIAVYDRYYPESLAKKILPARGWRRHAKSAGLYPDQLAKDLADATRTFPGTPWSFAKAFWSFTDVSMKKELT